MPQFTDKQIETALKDAGYFDLYVLQDEAGEVSIEYMPGGIAPNWRADLDELGMIPAWQISKIAAMKRNAKRVMRENLENL